MKERFPILAGFPSVVGRKRVIINSYAFGMILASFMLLVTPLTAQAYVGPGAGISLLAALWALIAVVGSAILYVVLWPLRRWRKRRRQQNSTQSARGDDASPAEGTVGDAETTREDANRR